MRVNIVTPCFMPVYLPIIACQLKSFTKFTIRWFIGFETTLKHETPVGHDFGHDFRHLFLNGCGLSDSPDYAAFLLVFGLGKA
jgi:hypothetical protein